jgi:uncharacterized radical SAM superfamily Fe-S cluster-containing enzyme
MTYHIKTLSICHHCYRHVPAVKFQKNGSIYLTKTCKEHGESTHLIEPDAEFYLGYNYHRHALQSYFIEITNRCNLSCPHCYQMPDNKSFDPDIELLLEKIKSWPNDGYPIALVGAEPTVRKDLPTLIEKIQSLEGKPRGLMILTNGVNLANEEYAKSLSQFKNVKWTFGLNHKDYQGEAVRKKQMQGIFNCLKYGMKIKNISYTLLDMSQLEDCVNELVSFGLDYCEQYRIRCGADIGRTPKGEQIYLSDLMKTTEEICTKNGYTFKKLPLEGNRAHYVVEINNIPVKIIQWPDATTLDLSEVQTEAIADILPGKPPSPLVHQVLLRDGAINKGLPLYDTIPKEWIDNYGRVKEFGND